MPALEKTSRPSDELVFTYRSKPKSLIDPKSLTNRPKYRLQYESDGQVMYGNIMFDRRVVRGNTYAASVVQVDPAEVQREQESKWRAIVKARARKQHCDRRRTPPPVEGRKHIEVQTELYLEAITDRVEETDTMTQTDVMLDWHPTPLFIPAKNGKDVETQIYQDNNEDDLFDFNREVKPILQVMVGKTMEQSMVEVLEEEELANLRYQQHEFEEVRNAELIEMQRLEDQERRYREEKEIRMEQQRWALRRERETADKIVARAFASSFLLDLKPEVFSCLYKKGYFFDRVERDIEVDFLPFTIEAGVVEVHNKIVARTILDCLIREVYLTRLDDFSNVPVSPPPTPPVKLPKIVPEKPVIPEPVPYKCEVEEYDYDYTYDGSC